MSSAARKVFVSYSHQQGDWVWDRLVPVLRAGGAEVLIDREQFTAGRALLSQFTFRLYSCVRLSAFHWILPAILSPRL
jgi:hypothetical protein